MKKFRVLALDGGGIRGLYSACFLKSLVGQFDKRYNAKSEENPDIGNAFDLICGTSTGAILTCALAAGIPIAQIINLYVQLQETYDYPKPSKETTAKVINYEGLKSGLPHYGRQAHPIKTMDWYGISTEAPNSITSNTLGLSTGKTFLFQSGHYYSNPFKYQFFTTLGLKSLKILMFYRHQNGDEPPQLEFRWAWNIQYAGKEYPQGENPLYPSWKTMPLYIRDASKYSPEDKLEITLAASDEDLSLVGEINGTIVFQDRIRRLKDKITQFAFEIDAEKPMIIEYKQ